MTSKEHLSLMNKPLAFNFLAYQKTLLLRKVKTHTPIFVQSIKESCAGQFKHPSNIQCANYLNAMDTVRFTIYFSQQTSKSYPY